LRPGDPAGSLIIGLDGHSVRPPFYEMGVDSRNDRDLAGFFAGGVLPGHPSAQFTVMAGNVPRRIRSVGVRLSDGRERPAVVFAGGTRWIWLGPRMGARPVALVGRDAAGTVVLTRPVLRPGALVASPDLDERAQAIRHAQVLDDLTSTTRRTSKTVTLIGLPVGALPANTPSCVPVARLRVQTVSPATTRSSIVRRKSEKRASQ